MKKSLLTFVAAVLVAQLAGAGQIYWTDRQAGLNGVAVCRQDGTRVRRPANLQGLLDPRGVAFSYRLGGLYVAARTSLLSSGGVLNVGLYLEGGLVVNPPVQVVFASAPRDLVIDEAGGWLYYADEGGVGQLGRLALKGQPYDPAEVFPKSLPSAYFLSVDPSASAILGGTSGPRLWRQAIDGSSGSETLTWDASLGIQLDEVRGVCVDPAGGWLYWCDKNLARISRARYDGTAVLAGPHQVLYSGLNAPHGLALDVEAGKLYWVDSGTNGASGFGRPGVNRGDLDGSGEPESLVAPPNSGQPWDLCLDFSEPSYGGYISRFFRKDAPAALTDPDADPDGDGLNNRLEYVLVRNPVRAESTPFMQPTAWVDPSGGGVYPAVIVRGRNGEGVPRYLIEVSFDLLTWYSDFLPMPNGSQPTVEVGRTYLPDDLYEAMIRSITRASDQPNQFFRIRVVGGLQP